MDFTAKVIAQVFQQTFVQVAGGRNLYQIGMQGTDFLGGSDVPHGSGIFHTELVAPFLQLAVLVKIKLQELAVFAVSLSVGVFRMRMRSVRCTGIRKR